VTISASPIIQIRTGRLSIANGLRVLSTRSRALLVFACCLVRKQRIQPNAPWVGIEELRGSLPSVHGKQMQRFVDALTEIQFPIEYESKTRGRYRLAVPAEQVLFDVDENGLEKFIGARALPSVVASAGKTLPSGESDLLLASLGRISLADSQYHDGNLDNGSNHAYEIWRREAETAQPEFKAIALLKFARVCRRLHRYNEAQAALRSLCKMVRSGEVARSTLEYKAQLCLAMLRYDQGRIDEARAITEKLDMRACADDSALGEYYNLMGLLAGYDMRTRHQAAIDSCVPPEADELPALLEIAAHYYRQALTMIASTNDYQAMQSTCFNLGNIYLHAYRAQFPMPDREGLLDQGIRWVAQCEFICSKFGVGMDSVWGRIVLLKAALDGGLGLGDLNRLTDGMFKNYIDLDDMALAVLVETARVGNRLEQAATLMILAEIARRKGDVNGVGNYRQQALEIYRKLSRADLIRQLKKDFPEKNALPGL